MYPRYLKAQIDGKDEKSLNPDFSVLSINERCDGSLEAQPTSRIFKGDGGIFLEMCFFLCPHPKTFNLTHIKCVLFGLSVIFFNLLSCVVFIRRFDLWLICWFGSYEHKGKYENLWVVLFDFIFTFWFFKGEGACFCCVFDGLCAGWNNERIQERNRKKSDSVLWGLFCAFTPIGARQSCWYFYFSQSRVDGLCHW